jgi:hypothetical protein
MLLLSTAASALKMAVVCFSETSVYLQASASSGPHPVARFGNGSLLVVLKFCVILLTDCV